SLSRIITDPKAATRLALSSEKARVELHAGLDSARRLLADKVDSFVTQLRDVLPFEVLDKQQAFRFFRRFLNYAPFKADSVLLKYDDFVDFFASDSALEAHRDHLRLDDHFVQVLTLKDPPAQTFAHLFRGLQDIRCNYIVATDWRRESNTTIRRNIQTMPP